MDTVGRTVGERPRSRGGRAAAAGKAFLLIMGEMLLACLLDMMDSIAQGLTDILFGDTT